MQSGISELEKISDDQEMQELLVIPGNSVIFRICPLFIYSSRKSHLITKRALGEGVNGCVSLWYTKDEKREML